MSKPRKKSSAVLQLNAQEWSHYFDEHPRLTAIDQMASTLQQDIRDLRIEQANSSRYLNERVDDVQQTVMDKLDAQTKTLTEHFDKGIERVSTATGEVSARVSTLENWRWLLVGGGVIVGFLVVDVIVRIFYGPVGQVLMHFAGWK